jgi:cold shock CspA family protein
MLHLDAFFAVSQLETDYAQLLRVGDMVKFNLTFTLRGPMAISIRI